MQSEFVFIYSTFPDEQSARRVATLLVQGRLAACVNIYPAMLSIYEWQGNLESSSEVAVFIKTRRSNVERAVAAARPLHPYSVPCFLVLSIESGNSDYLEWVRKQTNEIATVGE